MKYVTMWWALAGLLMLSAPESALAQMGGASFDQVEATPKGAIGLGLVGAEIGFIVPAAAGLDETWAFIVFPVLGATGGALGGHFLLDSSNRTSLSVAALVAGIALIVPSTVWTLSLTAYDPDDDAPEGQTAVEVGRAPPATRSPGPLLQHRNVLDTEPSGLALQVPVLSLRF